MMLEHSVRRRKHHETFDITAPPSLILSLIAAGCAVPTAAPPLAEEAASAEAPAEEAAMHPALEDGKITILGVSNYDGGRAAADLLVWAWAKRARRPC